MLTPPVSLHWQVTTSGHSQVVELKEYHVPLKSEILALNPAATDSNHNSDGNAPQELLITCMESAPQPTQPREVPHKVHLSSSLSLTSKLLMCSQTFFLTLNQYFKLTYLWFTPTAKYFLICHNSSASQALPGADWGTASHGSFSLPKHIGMEKGNYELTKL